MGNRIPLITNKYLFHKVDNFIIMLLIYTENLRDNNFLCDIILHQVHDIFSGDDLLCFFDSNEKISIILINRKHEIYYKNCHDISINLKCS